MNIPFREFPKSYRFTQGAIGFTFVAIALGSVALRACPKFLRMCILVVLGLIVLTALIASHYVIIRYPFISLVESEDADPFSKHFASSGSWIYKVLKILGLITPAMFVFGIALTGGLNETPRLIAFVYCLMLTAFMLFFTFFYKPLKHPTVTTFIRSTLGLGIPLYPIFAITIFIGAWRCRNLLDDAAASQFDT